METILTLCFIAGFVPWAMGMFIFFHIMRGQKKPADESNRINKIRLLWFALTRENLFTEQFPWLAKDELENVHGYVVRNTGYWKVVLEIRIGECTKRMLCLVTADTQEEAEKLACEEEAHGDASGNLLGKETLNGWWDANGEFVYELYRCEEISQELYYLLKEHVV